MWCFAFFLPFGAALHTFLYRGGIPHINSLLQLKVRNTSYVQYTEHQKREGLVHEDRNKCRKLHVTKVITIGKEQGKGAY